MNNVIKENDEENSMNTLENPYKNKVYILFVIIALSMSLYHLFSVARPFLSPVENQAVHLLFAITIIFLWDIYANKKIVNKIISTIFLAGGVTSLIYILINFDFLIASTGLITNTNVIIGSILIIVVLEGTRRTFGIALPILIVLSLLYVRYGYLLPGFFYHAGMEWPRLVVSLTTNFNGIFGTILDVSATFVVLFMIFGGLLDASGAGKFFLKLAMALGGRLRSGPAQAAVISSGLVGSINGSAVSNVATTGVFTIPLMKKVGYSPKTAAALESVASTGGMILPPVMGVGAFVMAGLTGIPYIQIAIAALVPALLYYASASITIHLHAVKNDFKKVERKDIPNLKKTLIEGFHFLIPLIAIIYFLLSGMSVMRAGFFGVVVLVSVVFIRRTIENRKYLFTKEPWGFLFNGLVSGAKNAMGVAAACAAMGIISQAFIMSGLAFKVVYFIQSLSGGQAFFALFLTMIISIFFGMGVPTTASYILVAVIGAPALTELGFPLLSVHLFIFYYAILANITPPVAAAVVVASKLAGSNYLTTGFTAMRIGLPGFILPFLFMYNQELLLQGQIVDIVIVIVSSLLGVLALTVVFEGYLLKKINIFERILFLITAIALIHPNPYTDIIGYILLIGLISIQYMHNKKLKTIS